MSSIDDCLECERRWDAEGDEEPDECDEEEVDEYANNDEERVLVEESWWDGGDLIPRPVFDAHSFDELEQLDGAIPRSCISGKLENRSLRLFPLLEEEDAFAFDRVKEGGGTAQGGGKQESLALLEKIGEGGLIGSIDEWNEKNASDLDL